MSARWTEADLQAYSGRAVGASRSRLPTQHVVPGAPTQNACTARKYRNVPTVVDGMRFDSKIEARRYEKLKLLRGMGEVQWFTRQVPFHLPGGVRYVADFLVVWRDGSVGVEDCKGMDTPMSKLKRKQVLELYGVEVRILTRGDV